MVGTFEIGLKKNAIKSVNMIIEYILQKLNSVLYRDQFMHDISLLMDEVNINMYEFYGRS